MYFITAILCTFLFQNTPMSFFNCFILPVMNYLLVSDKSCMDLFDYFMILSVTILFQGLCYFPFDILVFVIFFPIAKYFLKTIFFIFFISFKHNIIDIFMIKVKYIFWNQTLGIKTSRIVEHRMFFLLFNNFA